MYVLDPWQSTSVQGWRTSLQDVRQFTFVDERRSYASRTGQANEKMGWIEIAVYRERRPYVQATPLPYPSRGGYPAEEKEAARARRLPRRPSPRRAESARTNRDAAGRGQAEGRSRPPLLSGTGWGQHAHDPVVLVSFDPESEPSGRATLRYEYRPRSWPSACCRRTRCRATGSGSASTASRASRQPPRW
jgi:hypothetical protein